MNIYPELGQPFLNWLTWIASSQGGTVVQPDNLEELEQQP
jgi:hypothetical protein